MKLPHLSNFWRCLLVAGCLLGGITLAPAEPPASEKSGLPQKEVDDLLKYQPVVAAPAIFDGETFPKIDFLFKDLVAKALGPYEIKVRYFDAAWNEVTKPTGPGRYGALVAINFANGTTDSRRITLFKTAVPYNPGKDPYEVQVKFPAAFGLSKEVIEAEQWNVSRTYERVIKDAAHDTEWYATILAALHDMQADPVRWHGFNPGQVEHAWWAGLDQKLGLPLAYPYLVTLPPDYAKKPDEKWPLILFLHGSGERGTDLSLLKKQGPEGYINSGHTLPFIVLSPQCPRRAWWTPVRLEALLDEVAAKYRVDPKRIYVTGLSMGGYGTFDLAARFPTKFAAIAPLSGGETPDIADRLKPVPTWIFHGAEDSSVAAKYSTDIADRMKANGATEIKITLQPGVAHGGWNEIFADPALYDWFLKHSLP